MNDKKGEYIEIPETYSRRQLNALYREIPLKDTTSRTLRKYFEAMANLYGVIPLRKAYEIISEQSPKLVTKDEFLAFAEIARHEDSEYFILGDDEIYTDGKTTPFLDREIIDVSLFGSDIDLYIETKQSQQGKAYYIPKKTEFLKYEDPFYVEPTPESVALNSFIVNRLHIEGEKATALFVELIYGTRCAGVNLTQVMGRLSALGVSFDTDKDIEDFASVYQEFHNHTRMQCNRGFTPNELFSQYKPEERMPKSISFGPNIRKALADGTMDADELRKSILTMDVPSEELRMSLLMELADATVQLNPSKPQEKIGRNQLCPCGSGKKYKRCCGR